MKFAVKFFSDTPNPDNYPGVVICEQLVVDDEETEVPAGFSSLMTDIEIAEYETTNGEAYEIAQDLATAIKTAIFLRQAGVANSENRLKTAKKICAELAYYLESKGLSIADFMSLMTPFGPMLGMLNLGLLRAASIYLTNLSANAFLDATFDPAVLGAIPVTDQTLRQYLIARLVEGA